MTYSHWQHHSGHSAARMLLETYPTPRALRQGIVDNGTEIFPADVREIAVYDNVTLGGLITSVYFTPRDVSYIYAALRSASLDYYSWTAPDGTLTIRYP